MRHTSIVFFALLLAWNLSMGSVSADTYIITLDKEARQEPATGRVLLFFMTKQGQPWINFDPIEAPFFMAPQPIASIEVKDFKPGDSVTIDGTMDAFPGPLNTLSGTVRVQAVLDADQTERNHDAGPGNVYSEVLTVELSGEKDETVRIALTKRVEPKKREDSSNLKWVKFRSESLSEFYGRDIYHKAGVALPKGYNDEKWPRQQWPAIYVIPGFGGRDDDAEEYALMLRTRGVEEIGPIGVFIVLDPEAPLGHHGFADSMNNGPRGTAFIKEFIPYLESQFRIVPKREARIVTGHSSGGWSSLWLQLYYPETFGGCWSSAPDPIDMTAFQMTNLYEHDNMFTDADGNETPSYRRRIDRDMVQKTAMTVKQEAAMEYAMDPNGRSGQQWSAWNAMFSLKDSETGLPQPMFDWKTGKINGTVVRNWGRYDITRMMQRRWKTLENVVLNEVRLVCGEEDSFFLNRAVENFKKKVDELRGEKPFGDCYILLVPEANHDTVGAKTFQRWNKEMREYLQKHGLQDADPPAKSE